MNLPLKQATQEAAKKKRVRDLLVVAREAITDPAHWTKGEFARDKEGNALSTGPQRHANYTEHGAPDGMAQAHCFCGIGVLRYSANSHEDIEAAWPYLVKAVADFKEGSAERLIEVRDNWSRFEAGIIDGQVLFFEFNDHDDTTHAEVLAVYDAAIAIAAKDYADSLPAT